MSWVRIDDNAMDHPKILALTDGAFRLWVQGLAYCHKYLTDGFISELALKGLRSYSSFRRHLLLTAGLWEATPAGIQVHDFLQWNDSRDHVTSAREQARERMRKLRHGSRELTHDVRANVTANVRDSSSHERSRPTPRTRTSTNQEVLSRISKNQEILSTRARGKVFAGQHLSVSQRQHEWLVEELGPLAERLDLPASYERWDRERPIEAIDTLAYLKAKAAEAVTAAKANGSLLADDADAWRNCQHNPRCPSWQWHAVQLARQRGEV